ncbi:MAG: hypothetical protein ACREQM_21095 [Candidatus Dormibacteraceae bacterium]
MSLFGLYAEESGVPLPVPALAAWCGLEIAVVGGAINRYLLSRHFGRHLLEGWVGALRHLAPGRLEPVERWSRRWGRWP